MAKKKKRTRVKKTEVAEDEPRLLAVVGAISLFVISLLLLLGGFNTGGALPRYLFHAAYWLFGWSAYITPVVLTYWGVHKLMHESKRIPVHKAVSILAVLIFSCSWLFTGFVTKTGNLYVGGHGGEVGAGIGKVILMLLDTMTASIIFAGLTIVAVFFAFNIPPNRLMRLFKSDGDETIDSELGELKARAENGGFKLNEGVPVEHHAPVSAARLSSLKNTAQRLSPSDSHEALTIANDPDWKFPSVDLLNQKQDKADAGNVEANAKAISETFSNFNIEVEMEGANIGPRVTQYTLKPPANVKLTKITALENNLALDLAAQSIRMEAPIPGKRAVGIEVPNVKSATVRLSSILLSNEWQDGKSNLSFAIGKDISGVSVVGDLDKMPHLLIAGQTGSGKSVMINTLLTSLLYRNSPSDLKLILVDPKQVELKPYDETPHLLTPVITEPEKCISALKWAVAEMERRYKELADMRKRNIAEYNALKKEAGMPYIVIVIDELADLMMMAARDVEALIVRIAQKARAVGIHLVLATQRPSVDVITGLIKANVPARIAFTTASQVDSRTIIDQVGAEKLLGQGDMLYLTAEMPKPKRVQGALIGDEEISKVTDFIRMQRPPEYNDEVVSQPVQLNGKGGVVAEHSGQDADDDMWRDAVHVVLEARKASTSLLQRRLRIGYGRAARLIETMEEQGIISPADGSRPREVLVRSMDEVFGDNLATESIGIEADNAEEAYLSE